MQVAKSGIVSKRKLQLEKFLGCQKKLNNNYQFQVDRINL